MTLPPDSKELVVLLNARAAEYVVVGAHALAYHGVARTTGDIDIFVRGTKENASKICDALAAFGFGELALSWKDFAEPDRVIQLGVAPNRVDFLTSLDGVTFDEVWNDRIDAEFEGIATHLISKDLLIKNKRATGRPQDIADVARLEP